MIKLLSMGFVAVACLASEAVPVCSAVTEEDARKLIGPSAKRARDPSGCQWQDPGSGKTLNVARVGSSVAYESYRAHSVKDGKTVEEKGLGGPAFSTIPSSHRGGRAAIYLMKGEAILVVDIDGFAPGGAEERLPQVRELVRKLVPKL